MEHPKKYADDKPLGAPHSTEAETNTRFFEISDEQNKDQPPKPKKTWKTMPLWKKILVIWFLGVCAVGVYDTIFPSEKSLKLEDLMPIIATPIPSTSSAPTVTPSAPLSPTITISPSPKR